MNPEKRCMSHASMAVGLLQLFDHDFWLLIDPVDQPFQ